MNLIPHHLGPDQNVSISTSVRRRDVDVHHERLSQVDLYDLIGAEGRLRRTNSPGC